MIDLLMINGTVITMDKERRIIPGGYVAVDKGKIIGVGKKEELMSIYEAEKTVDCTNHVIMPGFVDAHGHAGHSVFKSVVMDTSYWMPVMTHTYKNYISDEFYYFEGRLSALERLHAGVTTGVSVMGSQPRCDDPIFAVNNSKGYAEVGVKNIVCTGPCSLPWPHRFGRIVNGKRQVSEVTYDKMLYSLESVIEQLNNSNNGKTKAYVAPFGVVTSVDPSAPTPADRCVKLTEHDLMQAKDMRRIAKKYNTRIHTDGFGGMIHLAYQDKENALLGPDVHLQHCTGLTIDEVMIIKETGTNISCSPSMRQLKFRTPVVELLELGVTVALTTDGSMLSSSFDMFSAMKRTQMVHRAASNDDYYLPSEKVLEMATIDAAKCVGLEDEIGSLEVGKKADIITIDMMKPHLMPRFNIVDTLVCNASHADVDMVFVDGEMLLEGGKAVNLNENEVMMLAEEEASKTIDRAGLQRFAYPSKEQWGQTKMYFNEVRFDIEENRKDGGYY
jgi:cytosine/adenosine deaminase-related metal-dependent hydrolase